jgi:hypothetical protein
MPTTLTDCGPRSSVMFRHRLKAYKNSKGAGKFKHKISPKEK